MVNSIFACTGQSNNCYDTSLNISNTNSIIGVGTLSDFGLAELADNGGPTQTMALLPASSLIDAGDDAMCANVLYRQQWVNFPGAPKTGLLSFDMPIGISNNLGSQFVTSR